MWNCAGSLLPMFPDSKKLVPPSLRGWSNGRFLFWMLERGTLKQKSWKICGAYFYQHRVGSVLCKIRAKIQISVILPCFLICRNERLGRSIHLSIQLIPQDTASIFHSTFLGEGPKINNYNWTLFICFLVTFLQFGTLPYLAESELLCTCAGIDSARCFQTLCYTLKTSAQSVGACLSSESGLTRRH